jgi:small subunit ribosomal protein S18
MNPSKKKQTKKFKQPQVKLSCPFGGNPDLIDYKDYNNLRKKYTTTRGRIMPGSKTGVSARCQRKLALSIKRARFMALLPYVNYV